MVRRLVSFVLIGLAALVAPPALAAAEVGDLDPSFGPVQGVIHLPVVLRGAYFSAEDVAIGTGDEVLVLARSLDSCSAGDCGSNLYLERIRADGSFDFDYGNGGASALVPMAASAGRRAFHANLMITPEGKALVVDSDGTTLTMARFLPGGGLDPTFGSGGIARGDFGRTGIGVGVRAAVAPDGRIVVASQEGPSSGGLVLARYLPDGTPDPEFAAGVGYEPRAASITPGGLALLPGGGIAVAGNACCGTSGRKTVDLGRWLPGGGAIGSGFPRSVQVGSFASVGGVFALGKGQIEVVGASVRGAFIARVGKGGRLVQSFARHGIARVGLLGGGRAPVEALVDGRGRTLIAGYRDSAAKPAELPEPLLVRRLANGRVDPNFGAAFIGNDGLAYPTAMALDSHGRIVVIGSSKCFRVCGGGGALVERFIGHRSAPAS